MKTLKRSIKKAEVGGEPLPPAFQAFERAGIILRRAEVTVIAGTPGAGKSSVALAIAAGESTLEVDAAYKAALEAQEVTSAERRKQTEQAVQDAKLASVSQALGAINGLVGAFAKGDEKRAKQAFKIQKAISIAQATVDTYKGANAIFASAAANPATVLFPAQPFIAAAAAIAGGIANVATIAQQQFQGSTPPLWHHELR